MLEEVLNFLQPKANGYYVDGTLGGGGHAEAILERSDPGGRVLGIDSDAQALERVERRHAAVDVMDGHQRAIQFRGATRIDPHGPSQRIYPHAAHLRQVDN